ncbi:hypothetical protein FraEuI1c_3648 [Pseudofrankia inefficax]|uniref:Uncharacterized protein n=1 Tax=Pseudofrankia inefficax (strain DSM 45817 / CECT 9037 / DDB 130130 / EuI1c) TaxID=298654 RepID=E3J1I7_PSEI1|nr:hypothetical protein FraEuI1c_3648 [Pseudofrankia inefficax]
MTADYALWWLCDSAGHDHPRAESAIMGTPERAKLAGGGTRHHPARLVRAVRGRKP